MEAVGSLAGGIAHDFNNLTTIITGYSELLLRSLDETDPLMQDIGEIKRAGEQAALLTRQLLAFSRKQFLRPRTLNLNDVVIELERMLRRLIGEDIDLIVPRSELIGYVKVDRSQIEQVILNLVVNARDAMPNGGKLTIRTENAILDADDVRRPGEIKPGAYACLIVEDTGIGMDAETQKHIFEPFFTTKELGKGTGLGLSSVYGTLKQSGGHITVASRLGQGAAFKIYLPLVEEEETPIIGSRETPTTLHGSETILLVEDERGVRIVIRKLLEQYGYRVLEVHNGDEALRLFATYDEPIQLIISDVVLPGGMSGYHLAERLTAIYPKTRALLISGYIDKGHPPISAYYSTIPFLQKPFALNTLIRTVRVILDRLAEV
jgi:CheY-like chemotaxis protein